jgi:N-acetylglucosamine-6-sulfatase
MLSGRYLHNLKADSPNDKSCMKLKVDEAFHESVLAAPLKAAGYRTLMAGKYLNGIKWSKCPSPGNATVVPPPASWDRFFAMCPDTCYTDCFFGDNGHGRTFNDTSYGKGSNYAPAVIGNVTLDFISESIAAEEPFFAYVAPHSPHSPATPAPWYKDAFPNAAAPRTASYNRTAPDKHWSVASEPPITTAFAASMDDLAKDRLRSLLTLTRTLSLTQS